MQQVAPCYDTLKFIFHGQLGSMQEWFWILMGLSYAAKLKCVIPNLSERNI